MLVSILRGGFFPHRFFPLSLILSSSISLVRLKGGVLALTSSSSSSIGVILELLA